MGKYVYGESLSSVVLLLNVFSGGVDPAAAEVAAPKAPPSVQNPAEVIPLGRCCTDAHYRAHTSKRLLVPSNICVLNVHSVKVKGVRV